MNNSKIISSSPHPNSTTEFFKTLQDRYLVKDQNSQQPTSKNKRPFSTMDKNKNKITQPKHSKKEGRKTKQISYKEEVYLDIGDREDQQQLRDALNEYDITVLQGSKESIVQCIVNAGRKSPCIWMNIQVQCLCSDYSSQQTPSTKTNLLREYCQYLIKCLNKVAVSMYSRASAFEDTSHLQNSLLSMTPSAEVFDMLSIRKQIKQDQTTLVKTNITSNAKSHLIVKKLIDFASDREILMKKQFHITELTIRLQPHRSLENQENYQRRQREPIIELKAKDKCNCQNKKLCHCRQDSTLEEGLMEGMKLNYKVFKLLGKEQTLTQILQKLQRYRRPKRLETEQELVEKIRKLQQELLCNKKQLQRYKSKVQSIETEAALEQDMEDLILPSERAEVNIGRYNRRQLLGSKKVSNQENFCDKI